MANNDVKLIGAWPSPFVMRARIALNLKSVKYEFLEEKFGIKSEEKFGIKSELLLKSNPVHKKIPVLLHDGKPISESLVIVQYIDEVWSSSPSILPLDPYDRAIARFWAAYIDDKWFPAMRGVSIAQGEEAKKAALLPLIEGLAYLEEAFAKISEGKDFFGGEKIGYLDIAFGCYLGWLRVTQKMNNVKLLDETKTPRLFRWADTFCADSAVKDIMPNTDKLLEFAKILMAKSKAPEN